MNSANFSIATVERDTGLSKDLLRMWERRYGFPQPMRDGNGERVYPADQVERLNLIKRLIDQGYRPGKLIAMAPEELTSLAPRNTENAICASPGNAENLDDILSLIKAHDAPGYHQAMRQRLARQGLQKFVQDTIAPLTYLVGEAWESGRFEVFEEHLFTEMTKRMLRQTIAALPEGNRHPRILLTSVPDELHMLGLLMAEALLALEGADCIPLGCQMPLLEIVRAAAAHQAHIVALSFSVAFPQRHTPGLLRQLRSLLPKEVALWAGGAGVQKLAPIDGVELIVPLEQAIDALQEWRSLHKETPPA